MSSAASSPDAPPVSGSIDSGPFRLTYRVEGAGSPALVIGSTPYYSACFSPSLRQRLRLAFIDHRGFAEASRPTVAEDFSLDQVVEDMERLRQHLGLPRCILVGHSGHGYMALAYADRYPQHVGGLVLIGLGPSQSPAHLDLAERHWLEAVCPERKAKQAADDALMMAEIQANPARAFVTFMRRRAARQWFDWHFDPASLWRDVPVQGVGIDQLWGVAFRDLEIRPMLERLSVPVLLALGRFDYIVAPPETWDPYRPAFRDLTLRIFDRSGHTPQLEEPDTFDAVLTDWLAAHGL